jgi:hypothetical protein
MSFCDPWGRQFASSRNGLSRSGPGKTGMVVTSSMGGQFVTVVTMLTAMKQIFPAGIESLSRFKI